MCVRRDSIDETAEDIAEEVVDELPATAAEFHRALPDDIQELEKDVPEELTDELSGEHGKKELIELLFSNTSLEKYFD